MGRVRFGAAALSAAALLCAGTVAPASAATAVEYGLLVGLVAIEEPDKRLTRLSAG